MARARRLGHAAGRRPAGRGRADCRGPRRAALDARACDLDRFSLCRNEEWECLHGMFIAQ